MNRRTAITTLLMGAPMVSTHMAIDPWKPDAGVYAVISRDGQMEVLLDNLRCLRVTMGGESIDVPAAEIFEALRHTRREGEDR